MSGMTPAFYLRPKAAMAANVNPPEKGMCDEDWGPLPRGLLTRPQTFRPVLPAGQQWRSWDQPQQAFPDPRKEKVKERLHQPMASQTDKKRPMRELLPPKMTKEKVEYWTKYKQQLTRDVSVTEGTEESTAAAHWSAPEESQPTTHEEGQIRSMEYCGQTDHSTENEEQTTGKIKSTPPLTQSAVKKNTLIEHGIYTSRVDPKYCTTLRPKAPSHGEAITNQMPMPKGLEFTTPKQKAKGKKRYEVKPEFQRTMEQNRMTPEQLREVAQNAHKLPEAYHHAIIRSRDLIRLPYNLFQTMDKPGSYSEYDREVGRYLFREDKTLLKEILKHDLITLCQRPHITAHALRVFCYKKFGIQNREVLPLIESDQMVNFYKKHRPQELKVQKKFKRKGKSSDSELGNETEEKDKENMLEVPNVPKQQTIPSDKKSDQEEGTSGDRGQDPQEKGTSKQKESQQESSRRTDHEGTVDHDEREQNQEEQDCNKENAAPDQTGQPEVLKRTIEELTDGNPLKKAKVTEWEKKAGTIEQPTGWEIADDGVLQYRTSAISMYQHKKKDMETEENWPPSTQEEQLTQTSDKTKTQNTVQTDEQSQTREAEQSCPISQIPAIRDDPPQKPTVLVFKDRPNDMTLQERHHMTDRRTLYGYSQAADWCNPQLRRIIRCPRCNKIVNTNGIEKAIRTHLRQAHQPLMQNPILVQVQRAGGKKQEFAIPAGHSVRQQKKPVTQTGKQKPRMLPAPLPLEKLGRSEEKVDAEEGEEKVDLEFDGVDQPNDRQREETDPKVTMGDKNPQEVLLPTKQPKCGTPCPQALPAKMPKSRNGNRMRPGLGEGMEGDTDAFESDEDQPSSRGSVGNSTICK